MKKLQLTERKNIYKVLTKSTELKTTFDYLKMVVYQCVKKIASQSLLSMTFEVQMTVMGEIVKAYSKNQLLPLNICMTGC